MFKISTEKLSSLNMSRLVSSVLPYTYTFESSGANVELATIKQSLKNPTFVQSARSIID